MMVNIHCLLVRCAMMHSNMKKHDLPHSWRRCSRLKPKLTPDSELLCDATSSASHSIADFRSSHSGGRLSRHRLFLFGVLPHQEHGHQVIVAELASSFAQPRLPFAGIPELLGDPLPVCSQSCLLFFEALDASSEGLWEVFGNTSCECGCTAGEAAGGRGGNRAIRNGCAPHGDQSRGRGRAAGGHGSGKRAAPWFAALLELRVRPCHVLLGSEPVSISGSVVSNGAVLGIHGCRKMPNKASTGISADEGKISINCDRVGRSADIGGGSCQ